MTTKVPEKCPRCDSPQPHLHPAMQFEGEVQPCPHVWHTLKPNDASWCPAISSPMPPAQSRQRRAKNG